MSKITGFIKRHRALTVLFVVLVVVAIVAVSCINGVNKALGEATANTTPNVTVLSQETLENIVTATGTLESTDIRQVTTTQTAEVEAIYVQVGDTVSAGDLLCLLDSSTIDKELSNAEEFAADANATDALGYNQAARSLNEAQAQYDADKADADKAVDNAKRDLDDAISLAESTAQQASNRDALRETRDRLHDEWRAAAEIYGDDSEETANAYKPYDEAWQAADAAEKLYDEAYGKFAEAIAGAQAAYDAAKTQRDATNRSNEAQVRAARDTVERQALNNTGKTYEKQAEALRDEKDDMNLYAPISGKVTAINAEIGVSAAGFSAAATGTAGLSSGLFEIQNTDSMQIVTSVAEYDVVQLENGMEVRITSDAATGETWEGVVSSISPTATDANANFEVTVTVTSDPGVLVPGMSARMNIIVESVEGVYAVPYDAVVTNEAGEQVVYAWVPGEGEGEAANQTEIPVQTGIENDYYVQIMSSQLEDGMQILNDPMGVNVNADFNMFGI